jgi:molecular chaperone GrpE
MSDMTEEQTIEEEPARDASSTPGGKPGVGPGVDGGPGVEAPVDGADPAAFDEAREADLAREGGEDEGDVDTHRAHGELVRTAAERDEYLALAQRTQADFENYRKRVARESALAQERGVAKLAKELLGALDNLDRALDDAGTAAEGGGEDDPLLDGVRLVRAELNSALARVGVESFSPAGEPFDPALHEAMAQQPVDDADSGTVVEVYQPGYRLGASIIRPARVVVAA